MDNKEFLEKVVFPKVEIHSEFLKMVERERKEAKLPEKVESWLSFLVEFEQNPDIYLSTSESILVGIAFCNRGLIEEPYASGDIRSMIGRLDLSQQEALSRWFTR